MKEKTRAERDDLVDLCREQPLPSKKGHQRRGLILVSRLIFYITQLSRLSIGHINLARCLKPRQFAGTSSSSMSHASGVGFPCSWDTLSTCCRPSNPPCLARSSSASLLFCLTKLFNPLLIISFFGLSSFLCLAPRFATHRDCPDCSTAEIE